jgi:methyl-accepting chemotaxis protein
MATTPSRAPSLNAAAGANKGLGLFGIGFAILGLAAVLAGSLSSKAVADATAATRGAVQVANAAVNDFESFSKGLSVEAPDVFRQIHAHDFEVSGAASGLILSPSAKNSLSQFAGDWSNLSSQASQAEHAINQADILRSQVAQSLNLLVAIGKGLEPYRTQPEFASAYDSVSRLQTYAEAGFGILSVPRVNYDAQNVVLKLHSMDGNSPDMKALHQEGEMLNQQILGPAALAVAAKLPNEKFMSQVEDAAKQAANSGSGLTGALNAAQTLNSALVWGGFFLAISGLVMLQLSVKAGARALTIQFNRGFDRFRAGEDDKAAVARDLLRIAKGDLNVELAVTSDDPALRQIKEAVTTITLNIRGQNASVKGQANSIAEDNEEAYEALSRVVPVAEKQSKDFSSVAETLSRGRDLTVSAIEDSETAYNTAHDAIEVADDGERALRAAGEQVADMRENMVDAARRVKSMGEKSQQLTQIADRFVNVAQEVKTLHLNLGLIAERADPATGAEIRRIENEFVTVEKNADAVSMLIEDVIKSIQSESRGAMESVETATATLTAGSYQSEIARASFSAIKVAIEHGSIAFERVVRNLQLSQAASKDTTGGIQALSEAGKVIRLAMAEAGPKIRNAAQQSASIMEEVSGSM